MALPITGQNVGTGDQQILALIKRMVDAQVASALRSLPIQWDAQGNITIPNGGNLTVSGAIESSNYEAGVAGYMLGGTQMTTYTAIQGFGNGQAVTQYATSFPLTTSPAVLASGTLTVPQGYSRLVGMASARVYAVNPNTTGGSNGAGGDAWYARAQLSSPGQATLTTTETPQPISGSNGFTTATSEGALQMAGLSSGQIITYSVLGHSAYQAVFASSTNYAAVSLAAFWLP